MVYFSENNTIDILYKYTKEKFRLYGYQQMNDKRYLEFRYSINGYEGNLTGLLDLQQNSCSNVFLDCNFKQPVGDYSNYRVRNLMRYVFSLYEKEIVLIEELMEYPKDKFTLSECTRERDKISLEFTFSVKMKKGYVKGYFDSNYNRFLYVTINCGLDRPVTDQKNVMALMLIKHWNLLMKDEFI